MRFGPGVMAALVVLPGCFSSREALISATDSQRLFGQEGFVRRVSFQRMGGGPLSDMVAYRWTGEGYELKSLANPREVMSYRIMAIDREWILGQTIEGGRPTYGLARREGPIVWTYAPECAMLNEGDRAALGLALAEGTTCMVTSRQQLRAALARAVANGMRPNGYYEAAPPPPLRRP